MYKDSPETRLLGGAVGFKISAELLHEAHSEAWQPCFVNLAFAFELALKAFLLTRGVDRAELKRCGHKLTDLRTRAEELGLIHSNVAVPSIIDALHQTHVDMSVRYLEGEGPELPLLPDVIAAANILIIDIWEQGMGGQVEVT